MKKIIHLTICVSLLLFAGCGKDELNAAILRAFNKKIEGDTLRATPFPVSWTTRSSSSASGRFFATAQTTEGFYERVGTEYALRKLGMTDSYEVALYNAIKKCDEYPEETRVVREAFPDDQLEFPSFFEIRLPRGEEVTITGTVNLIKLGKKGWQVDEIEVVSSSIDEKDFIPESKLRAESCKLDDPRTKDAVNLIVQKRKDFVKRVEEVFVVNVDVPTNGTNVVVVVIDPPVWWNLVPIKEVVETVKCEKRQEGYLRCESCRGSGIIEIKQVVPCEKCIPGRPGMTEGIGKRIIGCLCATRLPGPGLREIVEKTTCPTCNGRRRVPCDSLCNAGWVVKVRTISINDSFPPDFQTMEDYAKENTKLSILWTIYKNNRKEKIFDVEYQPKVDEMQQIYRKSLEDLKTKFQNEGNLEKTKAVIAEIERFDAEKSVPLPGETVVPEILQLLQSNYNKHFMDLNKSRISKEKAPIEKFKQDLEKLEIELVKEGKINEATVVNQARNLVEQAVKGLQLLTDGFVR